MTPVLRAPTREFRTFIMDGHRWDGFIARPDDIVVTTFPKCGTTWTQRIVDLLIHQSPEPRPIMEAAPWLDSTLFDSVESTLAGLEAQTQRRSVKSHMPLDALPIYEGVKYLHVARDGRDACFSMHNHMQGMVPEGGATAMAAAMADPRFPMRAPDPVPADIREWYLNWIERADAELTGAYGEDVPYFDFQKSYWKERRQPWLLMVHYNDLKTDLAGEMRRIADFLDIVVADDVMAGLVEAAGFAAMKAQGEALLPNIRRHFDNGPDRFLFKGANERWRDVLTDDDLARYDALVKRKFSPSLAAWAEKGRLKTGDPRGLPD
jgi:aryl sulfotransferase